MGIHLRVCSWLSLPHLMDYHRTIHPLLKYTVLPTEKLKIIQVSIHLSSHTVDTGPSDTTAWQTLIQTSPTRLSEDLNQTLLPQGHTWGIAALDLFYRIVHLNTIINGSAHLLHLSANVIVFQTFFFLNKTSD